jgi:Ca-activated chloride channel homolog
MYQKKNKRPAMRRRRGAMLVLLAVMLFLFFMAVAFSVDIAYMHLVRGELRTATDAAAKAAAQTLARTQDVGQAIARGQQIAQANTVARQGLQLDTSDFQFGNSKPDSKDRFNFSANKQPTNSVRVSGRRTASSRSGSVGLFFGKVLGVSFFEPSDTAIATFVERDIVVVVDRSGSMLGQKFIDLQRSVGVFVSTLSVGNVDTRVGLASYSTTATQDVQMTTDYRKINRAMSSMFASGFTSISGGIKAGTEIMRGTRSSDFVERTMILMTDGIHNTGIAPEGPAADIAGLGVTIHTISFGADADRARMRNIAAIGKGKAFHADTGLQLENVFREIALTLNTVITE